MAITYTCDGCEKAGEKTDLESRGIAQTKDYCANCVVIIDEFLAERDELHDAVQKHWNTGLKKLQKKYHKEFKGQLPDEGFNQDN